MVSSRGRPDHRAEDEQAKSSSCLLEQPLPKLPPALGELGLLLLASGRELGEVREEPLQLLLGTRAVGRLDAVRELVLGDPPGREVLAELLGSALSLLVGNAKLGRSRQGTQFNADWVRCAR